MRQSHSNPFLRYRKRLDCYAKARARGWSDSDFVSLVERLDAGLGKTGFAITPITDSAELARAINLEPGRLLVKDDTGNVGGSHKARHLFGVLLHLAIDGEVAGDLAIASCGNAALAAAVVARSAERALRVFIPTWADAAVVSQLEALGANITVCDRRRGERGDPAYLRFTEAVQEGAVPFSCQGTMTRTTLDGGRTIGWELAEQLADARVAGTVRLYVQVGGGALASAAWSGLRGGARATVAADIEPVLHCVQSTACAPLARAWDRLAEQASDRDARIALARAAPGRFMWPWERVGMSAASGILDDVTYDWLGVVEPMLSSGGWPVTVAEALVVEAHRLAHAHTDIDVDATGTSGLAGVLHDVANRAIGAGEYIVVLFTGVQR